MADEKLRLVESREEDPGGEGLPVVVPTLQLPDKVAQLVSNLNLIAQEAEGIAVLRPILAFWRLHRIRPRFDVERGKAFTYSIAMTALESRWREHHQWTTLGFRDGLRLLAHPHCCNFNPPSKRRARFKTASRLTRLLCSPRMLL